jgi:hypothetical protein
MWGGFQNVLRGIETSPITNKTNLPIPRLVDTANNTLTEAEERFSEGEVRALVASIQEAREMLEEPGLPAPEVVQRGAEVRIQAFLGTVERRNLDLAVNGANYPQLEALANEAWFKSKYGETGLEFDKHEIRDILLIVQQMDEPNSDE